mmetsp:Transcript_103273/g.333076  ORF Transcript_103273/g.333076 Transcript_103273/m.333076 type:complete len:407 (-) Transcript_103273:63-1283(-)
MVVLAHHVAIAILVARATCERLVEVHQVQTQSATVVSDGADVEFLAYLVSQEEQAKGELTAEYWEAAAKLTTTMFEGVKAALGEEALQNARFDLDNLKFNFNLQTAVEGEIATKSRVPIQWLIDTTASIQVAAESGRLKLKTKGLAALPFEGLQVYADSQKAMDAKSNMDPKTWMTKKTDKDRKDAALKEAKAVYKYVESKIPRSMMGGAKYYFEKGFLEKPSTKTFKVWNTIREMTGYSVTVGASDGSVALYAMLLGTPNAIVAFNIVNFEGKGLRISIEKELYSGPFVGTVDGMPADQFCKENHVSEKASALFDPAEFPKQRSMAERFAASAMNYAAAIAAGDPEVTAKNGGKMLEGAKVDVLVRFFKPCTKQPPTPGKAWESHDVTWDCQGKVPGRVIWRRRD